VDLMKVSRLYDTVLTMDSKLESSGIKFSGHLLTCLNPLLSLFILTWCLSTAFSGAWSQRGA